MKFSNKLLYLREKAGMSQEDLAEIIKVPEQTIIRWEAGIAIPDVPYLIRISGLFGVSIDYLINEDFENTNSSTPNEVSHHGKNKEKTHNKLYLITSILMYVGAISFFLAGGFTNIYLFLVVGLFCVISASGLFHAYFKGKTNNVKNTKKDAED